MEEQGEIDKWKQQAEGKTLFNKRVVESSSLRFGKTAQIFKRGGENQKGQNNCEEIRTCPWKRWEKVDERGGKIYEKIPLRIKNPIIEGRGGEKSPRRSRVASWLKY